MRSAISGRRFWTLHLIITVFFLIVTYQLFQLMLVRRPALLELAAKQHGLRVSIPPLRGQILDRNAKELATNLKIPSVYAVPRTLPKAEIEPLARKLQGILGLSPEFLRNRLSRDKAFIWLKRKVGPEEALQIEQLKSPALGIVKEYKRLYPQGDLLAHILGFSNVDNQGLEGLELYLNRDLQGRPGSRLTKRDALGREIRAFEIRQIPAMDGHSVTLTIDQYLQYLTENALEKAFKTWKALGATAVLMEAKTGKILAMASRPTYDPNRYAQAEPASRRNRAVTDMYEPGSVFKIVAASAVLNENQADPKDTFDCEQGAWRYGSRVLHDVHPYGMLSFEDVIVKSSNIGTVKIAQRLAPETFHSYIRSFGFGAPSGIDLPGEASGYVRPPKEWSATSPYNIPIGQEVMVTALHMTAAMAVIANGGELVKPYVISRITDQAGVVLQEKKPVIKRRVIRPEVAETMRRILVRAVEEGTGKSARIKGIAVGGKTGTAQKVLPNGRGYSHSNFMASFIGFAPAEDPQYVMCVVLDDPRPMYYGGVVAAPVFKEVMEVALLSKGYVPYHAQEIRDGVLQTPAESQRIIPPPQGAGRAL